MGNSLPEGNRIVKFDDLSLATIPKKMTEEEIKRLRVCVLFLFLFIFFLYDTETLCNPHVEDRSSWVNEILPITTISSIPRIHERPALLFSRCSRTINFFQDFIFILFFSFFFLNKSVRYFSQQFCLFDLLNNIKLIQFICQVTNLWNLLFIFILIVNLQFMWKFGCSIFSKYKVCLHKLKLFGLSDFYWLHKWRKTLSTKYKILQTK